MKRLLFLLGFIPWLGLPGVGRADLVVSATNSVVTPGATGGFDVLLTNTDSNPADSQSIAAFSFQISVPAASGIQFTGIDFGTGPAYIFAGNSFDQDHGQPLSFDGFPGTSALASDLGDFGAFQLFGQTTVGLGHITYQASDTFSGSTTVSFEAFPVTDLLDDLGNDLPVTLQAGTIAAPAPVPEPATIWLLGMGGASLGAWRSRRRR